MSTQIMSSVVYIAEGCCVYLRSCRLGRRLQDGIGVWCLGIDDILAYAEFGDRSSIFGFLYGVLIVVEGIGRRSVNQKSANLLVRAGPLNAALH